MQQEFFSFHLCLLPLAVNSISNDDFESFKLEMNHLRSRQDDDHQYFEIPEMMSAIRVSGYLD